jgi:tight adherence protein C
MIESIAYILLYTSLIGFVSLGLFSIYLKYKRSKRIETIFNLDDVQILSENEDKRRTDFKLKLLKAGMTKKEFNEIIVAGIIAAMSLLFLVWFMDFSFMMNVFIIVVAVAIAAFMPLIYLEEQITARVKRIDNDLAIFLDLLIIILEGGGGLHNAIDKVTQEGEGVLGIDLLTESRTFKNEFITYSSEVAYNNLAQRTGSEAIAAIVGFMKLSEETGIGVKTIFENQAEDIKSAEILNVEKRAASMNIGMTLVMFIFIIPAVIAMIAFPMAANALMPGF